jgi:hypothetical protein
MTVRNKSLEQRLAHAYALLWHVSEDEHGSRSVSLGRYGSCDLRLVEVTGDSTKSLWLELYDLDGQVALDSCKCDRIEVATVAAELLISQTRELDKGIGNGGQSPIHRCNP